MKTVLHLGVITLLSLIFSNSFSQTLANQLWTDTSGQSNTKYNFVAGATDEDGNVIILNNVLTVFDESKFLLTKYDPEGNVLWVNDYSGSNIYGTSITADAGRIYVTAVSLDATETDADWIVVKFDAEGNILWNAGYAGSFGGRDVPVKVQIASEDESVYVVGTEQTELLDSKYVVIKYDSTGSELWVGEYDSVGQYDVATGIITHTGTTNVGTFGFSGTSTSNWDVCAVLFDQTDGTFQAAARLGSGSGTFTKVVSVQVDALGNFYVAGSFDSASITRTKIVKFRSSLSVAWVEEYMAPGSIATVPTAMSYNPTTGLIAISATATKLNGGQDAVAIAYRNDSFQWAKNLSAADPTKPAMANDIIIDALDNVYIAGGIFNGSRMNYLTQSYDSSGNTRWIKTYSRCSDCDDVAQNIIIGGTIIEMNLGIAPILVNGISMGPVDTTYATVFYEQQPDSLGLGVIMPAEIIDHIRYSDFVFEGTVISTNSYANAADDFIYTSNTIQVSKVFKGELECGTVELITLGGTVDDKTLWISHNIQLNQGEFGVFLTKETTREISSVDFYSEDNDQKLYMPYNEEGFIKYYVDGINSFVSEEWAQWDNPMPMYNLLEHVCEQELSNCEALPLQGGGENDDNLSRKNKPFPHYTREAYDYQMSIAEEQASKAIKNKSSRDVGTLIYSFQNPIITGTTTKYLEFDIALSDDISTGWFNHGLVHVLYNTSVFGSDIVYNSKIEITRGTVLASVNDYLDPTPIDISTGVVAIPLTGEIDPVSLYELSTTPIDAVHVRMEIANCNISNASISMTNEVSMLSFSLHSPLSDPEDTTTKEFYSAIDNSSSFEVPECKPKITSFSPEQVNAGVGDSVTIKGYLFGNTKGSGGVYMRNADNGGGNFMCLNNSDYLFWSDTLIKVLVPSVVDTVNLFNKFKGSAGSGEIKVKTNSGDSTSSATPLNIFYSVMNTALQGKKYMNNLYNPLGTGGYRFSIDSSVYNNTNFKTCVVKAIHDWVCLTGVNFEVGSDTISTADSHRKDGLNMIQVASTDDTVIMQTQQWRSRCPSPGEVAVDEIDIIIGRHYYSLFQADTNASHDLAVNKLDFYEEILHELGHAHSLDHVNDPTAVMFYGSQRGYRTAANRRVKLHTDARCSYGGNYVLNESSNIGSNCGWTPMSILTGSNCTDFNSIRKPFTENSIKFFPNPTDDKLNIQFALQSSAKVQIQVFGITGNLVYQSLHDGILGEQTTTVPTSDWASGFYLINVSVNNQKNIAKVVKN